MHVRHVKTLLFACLAAVACVSGAFAQTAEEIIARNLQAKGGVEKWKTIASVKMTGTLSAQGQDVPMTVYTKRPNLLRQDITTPAGKAVQAFDGATAWVIPPGADTPREVSGPQADAARSNSDFDGPLLDHAAKGHRVELIGREKVGAAEAYHLKLTRKDGGIEHYYIDVTSSLEVKRSAEMNAGGAKRMLESELSNYRAVDGVMVPHTMTQSVDGAPVMQVKFSTVQFNVPMDDDLFRMPKVQK